MRLIEQGVGTCPRRGLSFRRPNKRAGERGPETVRVRHEETWPATRAKAGAEGGGASSHTRPASAPTSSPATPGGAEGHIPVVRRSPVNTMPAVNTESRTHFTVSTETFGADAMCRFPARPVGRSGDPHVRRTFEWNSSTFGSIRVDGVPDPFLDGMTMTLNDEIALGGAFP